MILKIFSGSLVLMESVTCLLSKHEDFHSDFHSSCTTQSIVAYNIVRVKVYIYYIHIIKLIIIRQRMMEEDTQAQPRAYTNVHICAYTLCIHT